MKQLLGWLLVAMFISGCEPKIHKSAGAAVDFILNDWHDAAAKADSTRYFGHFASKAIFMGTDDTEYWTKESFQEWSRPYFQRGRAWSFKAIERNVYLGDDGETAWFDEKLETPNMGPCRGSGVLSLQRGKWLIRHYNLTIPIPNDLQKTVSKQIADFLAEQGK